MPAYTLQRLLVPAVALASLLCLALIVAGCDSLAVAATPIVSAVQARGLSI